MGQCSPSLPCLGCNLIGTVSCYFLLSLSAHSRSDLFYTATFPPALQPRLFLSFITTSPSRTFSVSSSPGSNAFLHPSLYHCPPLLASSSLGTPGLGRRGRSWLCFSPFSWHALLRLHPRPCSAWGSGCSLSSVSLATGRICPQYRVSVMLKARAALSHPH